MDMTLSFRLNSPSTMDRPELYSENHSNQSDDTRYILERHFDLLRYSEGDSVLDVGCGDGDILVNLLMPYLKNCGKLVGTDISEEMVNFARKKFENNEKVRFVQMDITSKDVPGEFLGEFHHVVSFYCFHWIQDQRQAIRNIHRMLRPGGGLFMHVLCYHPVFSAYEVIAKSPEWSPYLQDTKKYISPWHHSQKPDEGFAQLLQEEGYSNIHCETYDLDYVYPSSSHFKNFLTAINAFTGRMPLSKVENYMQDLFEVCLDQQNIVPETSVVASSAEPQIKVTYKLLFVAAVKGCHL